LQKMTIQALNRLPYYLSHLKNLKRVGIEQATATMLADELRLNEVVVRKDLSAIRTEKGKPNTGFPVQEMILRIEDYLGYNNTTEAVLVGAGPLGRSLVTGMALDKFGMHIVAAFDEQPDLVGKELESVEIFPMSKLTNLCGRLHIQVGIIAVPEQHAQGVCNLLVSGGIKYILNYAQVYLEAPEGVFIQNENPAASVVAFLQHIRTEADAAGNGEEREEN